MYTGITDPFLAGLLGVTPNADGTNTVDASGLMAAPGFALPAAIAPAARTDTPQSPGQCPAWVPALFCSFVNAVPGAAQAGQAGNAAGKAVTGKDNATTTDVVQKVVPDVQALLVTGGVILGAVLLVALGVWSIVKD